MKPIELLKLAEQADREGRYAIADKLTIRATRIAAGLPSGAALEGAAKAGLEGAAKAAEEAAAKDAAEALAFGTRRVNSPGHSVEIGGNLGGGQTKGGVKESPITMTETVGQQAQQAVKQRNVNSRKITIDGQELVIKDQTTAYLESLLPRLEGGNKDKVKYILDLRKKGNPFKQKANLEAKQTGTTGAQDSIKVEAPSKTTTDTSVVQSGSPFNAGTNSRVFNVSEGSTMNMGVSNAALLGVTGIVAGLGALGMYLGRDGIVRDRDNVVVAPQDIPANIAQRLPRYQMMTRREEAGQIGGQRALDAQNFVDANASNPRVKNQRDWYNLALQTSGGDKNFANNVITYVKASPEMPSQVGGGSNI
jgi:hypothetical protein